MRDVFLYRSHFEALLEKIFIAVGKTYRLIPSRIKQEQFKQRVMCVFRNFEEMALYPVDKLIHNQNVFLGLIEMKSERKEEVKAAIEEEDEDLDGVPIGEVVPMKEEDDEEIDGVPLDEVPMNSSFSMGKIEEKPVANKFKPVQQVRSFSEISPRSRII